MLLKRFVCARVSTRLCISRAVSLTCSRLLHKNSRTATWFQFKSQNTKHSKKRYGRQNTFLKQKSMLPWAKPSSTATAVPRSISPPKHGALGAVHDRHHYSCTLLWQHSSACGTGTNRTRLMRGLLPEE